MGYIDGPQQAGVIAFRRDARGLRLCVSFKPKKGAWGIPKGFIDPGDNLAQTALNEAREEVGLRGHLVGSPIGTYDYTKWGFTFTVAVYVMEVTAQDDNWEEKSIRERHWLSPDNAAERLQGHPVSQLLARAIVMIDEQEADA